MNAMLARKIFDGMREQARKEVTQDEWNKWTIEAIEKAIVEAEARGVRTERARCAKIAADFREESGQADHGAEFYKTACSVIRDRILAQLED